MRSVLPVAISALTCSAAVPTATASEVELIFVARVTSVAQTGDVGSGTEVGDHLLLSYTYDSADPTSNTGLDGGLYIAPVPFIGSVWYAPGGPSFQQRFAHFPADTSNGDILIIEVETANRNSSDPGVFFEFSLIDTSAQALTSSDMPPCVELDDWEQVIMTSMSHRDVSPAGDFDDDIGFELVGQIRGYCDGFDRPFAVAEWCTLDTDLTTGTQTVALDASGSLGDPTFFFWRPLTPGSPMPADDNTPDATVDLTPGTHVYEVVVATSQGWDAKAQVEIVAGAPPAVCGAGFTAWLAAFNLGCD